MDNKENNIIKRGPSQKDKLLEEKKALEKELRELSGVSEAQIGYKKARIKLIDKMLAQIDQSNGKDNNKEMAQQEYLKKMMMQNQGMGS
ncbi:MAG: hypothetical protein R8M37_04195 [Alphaproteobacteria bacterium]|nr:hypothetical protein [Alphaproteobacteria bacterium]